jgi:hypothetical protein
MTTPGYIERVATAYWETRRSLPVYADVDLPSEISTWRMLNSYMLVNSKGPIWWGRHGYSCHATLQLSIQKKGKTAIEVCLIASRLVKKQGASMLDAAYIFVKIFDDNIGCVAKRIAKMGPPKWSESGIPYLKPAAPMIGGFPRAS